MSRYLLLLGVVVIVFSIGAGSIEISSAYNNYQSRLHVSGIPGSNPLTVIDEAQWQAARLVGSILIFAGVISGSMLMGLGWIGKTLEQIREVFAQELAESAAVAPKS